MMTTAAAMRRRRIPHDKSSSLLLVVVAASVACLALALLQSTTGIGSGSGSSPCCCCWAALAFSASSTNPSVPKKQQRRRQQQPKTLPSFAQRCKILILPGFGNDSNDYTMDGSLVDSLVEEGWPSDQIVVLPVERKDWFQVFLNGAFDIEFWKGDADPTRPAFRWYLQRIADQIEQMTTVTSSPGDEDDEEEPSVCSGVILVGHSAGGWLGRAAMGFGSDGSVDGNRNTEGDEDSSDDHPSSASSSGPPVDLSKVLGIVSLGAPHLPPPPEVMDMTRGALRITNERFPGSFHHNKFEEEEQQQQVFYLTVIGNAIRGEQQRRSTPFEPTTIKGFAYNSYEAVCGDGTTVGDGVVPVCSAHLDGAQQLDLDGVLHSINAPDNWYGSTGVINQWHTPMLVQLKEHIAVQQKLLQKQQQQQ